jgi:hypothetical protein
MSELEGEPSSRDDAQIAKLRDLILLEPAQRQRSVCSA